MPSLGVLVFFFSVGCSGFSSRCRCVACILGELFEGRPTAQGASSHKAAFDCAGRRTCFCLKSETIRGPAVVRRGSPFFFVSLLSGTSRFFFLVTNRTVENRLYVRVMSEREGNLRASFLNRVALRNRPHIIQQN